WVIPFRLAASSTPRSARDVQACSHPSLGITLIITLTEEEPLPSDWFPHGMRNTFLPIKNGGQPSLEESHAFTGIVAQEIASGGKVLVHCGGGKGRAGSLIASWLSAFGFTSPSLEIETLAGGFRAWVGQGEWSYPAMGASQSIEAIRSLRPGSIETVEQETFVRKWNQFIAKEGPWPKRIQEPVDSEPSIDSGGESLERALQDVDLVVLVGLPGSGKSTFRKLLCQRDPDRWASVSGDEDGGRRAIERALCNHSRGKRGLVIDRTNITPSSRKEILRLAQHSIKVIAIHFDFPPELCKSRATLRLGHPTLRPSSAGRVIEAFAKELVKPERFEGFSSVITISSIRAAQTLATILSPVQLFKFPRTPHILDLGAASPDDLVLDGWMERHREDLYKVLDRGNQDFPERWILFGEWMAAVHSIHYTHLPSLFLAYDIYDRKEGIFLTHHEMVKALSETEIPTVPLLSITREIPTARELVGMTQERSRFLEGRREGIYVRIEDGSRVKSRGKVVREDFIAGNVHWTKNLLSWNGVREDLWE
ncbi:phosphatases II, partial [Violaceomyces palustris]